MSQLDGERKKENGERQKRGILGERAKEEIQRKVVKGGERERRYQTEADRGQASVTHVCTLCRTACQRVAR